MTGDCHVRFYESRGVRFPPATHQSRNYVIANPSNLGNYVIADSVGADL